MKVTIGGVRVDLLKEFDTESSLQITSHPVEDGADVSDHARLNNYVVGMTALVVGKDALHRLQRLERLQSDRKQVEIVGPRRYKGMQIASIQPNFNYQTANGYVIDLTLQQVRIASAKTVKLGKTNSGRKQTKKKKATTSKSNINKLATEVIQGKWGNNPQRRQRLTKAGHNYNEVQAKVNARLR